MLPWQQLSYDLNDDIFFNIPHRDLLPCKFEWEAQNFSFPTLYVSYRALLLISHELRNNRQGHNKLALRKNAIPNLSLSIEVILQIE